MLAPGDVQNIDNSEAFAALDDLAQTGSVTEAQYVSLCRALCVCSVAKASCDAMACLVLDSAAGPSCTSRNMRRCTRCCFHRMRRMLPC